MPGTPNNLALKVQKSFLEVLNLNVLSNSCVIYLKSTLSWLFFPSFPFWLLKVKYINWNNFETVHDPSNSIFSSPHHYPLVFSPSASCNLNHVRHYRKRFSDQGKKVKRAYFYALNIKAQVASLLKRKLSLK